MSAQQSKRSISKITDSAHQAARAECAPAHVRHYRAVWFQVTLVAFTVAFAVLTYLVKTVPSFAIDLQITRAIQTIDLRYFSVLMSMVSWPGFAPQSVIIAALIILLLHGFGLHWESLMALIAAVLTTAINVLVKDLIQRPRPTSGSLHVTAILNDYSFPSGHVMFYIAFFGFIGFLVFTLLKPSLKRTVLLALFGGLIVLIGPSRIYLGQHWASDVLGACLLGSLTLVAITQSYRWGQTRFFVHQPVAPTAPKQG